MKTLFFALAALVILPFALPVIAVGLTLAYLYFNYVLAAVGMLVAWKVCRFAWRELHPPRTAQPFRGTEWDGSPRR